LKNNLLTEFEKCMFSKIFGHILNLIVKNDKKFSHI
jgi:hypothetical protein